MLKHPVQRIGFGLLIIALSACQSAPASQPSPSLPPVATSTEANTRVQGLVPQASATIAQVASPTLAPTKQATSEPTQASVATATSAPTQPTEPNLAQVQTNNQLPALLQAPTESLQQINPNSHGLLAVPVSLPARSSQLINESSLTQIELLQTIGLGQLKSGDFAPNNQFMAVVTSKGFGVYELPSLQQRYFLATASAISAVRVTADNATIEALIEISSDPALAGSWSIERYNAVTGEFIDRQPTSDTIHTWITQPTNYDQPNPRIISPDGLLEARFAIAEGMPSDSDVTLIRLADQQPIYSGKSSYNLRFSADSSQALLIDDQALTLVRLSDGQSQTLSFPVYHRPQFSPNSQLLALAQGLRILNLEQTSIAYEIPQPVSYRTLTQPDFSSDSSQINLGISQWNLSDLSQRWQQQLHGIDDVGYTLMATDADQQLVVEAVSISGLELHVAQAGQPLYSRPLDPGYLVDLALVPNQNRLVLLSEQGQLSLLELTTGTTLQNVNLNQAALGLAVSPDGQSLAVAMKAQTPEENCIQLVNLADLQVSQRIQCHSSSQALNYAQLDPAIQFSPDGQLLLVQSSLSNDLQIEPSIIIYRFSDGQAVFSSQNALIAPDQRLIVSIDRGQLQLWGIRE
ncbi:hypothetical protein ACP8Y2_04635 [Herpetosiphon llansteffanensis]